MNSRIRSFILVAVFGGLVLLVLPNYFFGDKKSVRPEQVAYKDITSQELFAMLAQKDFFFVNVHVPYEGEIEKTDVFIPYDQIDNNLDKLPEDKKAKIVLYCKTGRMSAIAAGRLAELGYVNVKNLSFGMHDWQSKGYPLIINP